MAHGKYELLKERALIHFEMLLITWGKDYIKAGDNEYDFLSPTRSTDTSFGACRFNVSKGIGADFAGTNLRRQDYESIGIGFDKSDFLGFSSYGETRNSFDIIGLAQRIYNKATYKEAAEQLEKDLDGLNASVSKEQLLDKIAEREALIELRRGKSLLSANKMWSKCLDVTGTIGETYLNSRKINGPFNEPNMKFHRAVYNTELNLFIPAVLFKVSKTHDGMLEAVHRIWIADDGSRKARLQESKKAIGQVHGNGIWFGTPSNTLYVCEGPEEALTVRCTIGKTFVVSTVYATNFDALTIPGYVKQVVLVPDNDDAGKTACAKAIRAYERQGMKVRIVLPIS
jgi:hypothetical protein